MDSTEKSKCETVTIRIPKAKNGGETVYSICDKHPFGEDVTRKRCMTLLGGGTKFYQPGTRIFTVCR